MPFRSATRVNAAIEEGSRLRLARFHQKDRIVRHQTQIPPTIFDFQVFYTVSIVYCYSVLIQIFLVLESFIQFSPEKNFKFFESKKPRGFNC